MLCHIKPKRQTLHPRPAISINGRSSVHTPGIDGILSSSIYLTKSGLEDAFPASRCIVFERSWGLGLESLLNLFSAPLQMSFKCIL